MKNKISKNKIDIGRKMYGMMILLIMSVILAGCIDKSEVVKNDTNETVVLKYIENRDSVITKDDFPDFKLIDHRYFVVPENLTLSLETESFHGTITVNASDGIPNETRLYGGSERYNVNDRHMILQYKVFDKNDKLDESLNMTLGDYIRVGFRTISVNRSLSDIIYGKRIFVLEMSGTNRTNINNTNNTSRSHVSNNITNANKSDTNIIIILFGYDTVLGKIGVQDSKNRSLDESLKMLEIVLNRLEIKSKEMIVDKEEMINQSIREQGV